MLSLPFIPPRNDMQFAPPGHNTGLQTEQMIAGLTHLSLDNDICRRVPSDISPYAQLRTDENIIEQRKLNVRRFGAGWLRPPGVAKTLQSRLEEAQEQMEQMEMQRRDAELRAQEQAAAQVEMDTHEQLNDQHEQEDRDLDADVPDGADGAMASDEDSEYIANITFNEASLMEGSPSDERQAILEREDAELDGRLQDARDLGMEEDLDDDVPEAGSYEHTDTELEDESFSDEHEDEMQVTGPARHPGFSSRIDGRARRSLVSEDPDLLSSSSFMASSPAISRRPHVNNVADTPANQRWGS